MPPIKLYNLLTVIFTSDIEFSLKLPYFKKNIWAFWAIPCILIIFVPLLFLRFFQSKSFGGTSWELK